MRINYPIPFKSWSICFHRGAAGWITHKPPPPSFVISPSSVYGSSKQRRRSERRLGTARETTENTNKPLTMGDYGWSMDFDTSQGIFWYFDLYDSGYSPDQHPRRLSSTPLCNVRVASLCLFFRTPLFIEVQDENLLSVFGFRFSPFRFPSLGPTQELIPPKE